MDRIEIELLSQRVFLLVRASHSHQKADAKSKPPLASHLPLPQHPAARHLSLHPLRRSMSILIRRKSRKKPPARRLVKRPSPATAATATRRRSRRSVMSIRIRSQKNPPVLRKGKKPIPAADVAIPIRRQSRQRVTNTRMRLSWIRSQPVLPQENLPATAASAMTGRISRRSPLQDMRSQAPTRSRPPLPCFLQGRKS